MFFYYLSEVRYRIFYLSVSFFVTFCTCYYYSLQLIYLFARPFLHSKHYSLLFEKGFIFTNLTEAFHTTLKICFIWSFVFCLPFVFYQCWSFLTPSWYLYEKRKYKIYVFSALFLAFLASFCFYFLVLPEFINFLLTFKINTPVFTIQLEARIDEYVKISSAVFLIVQSIFQMPVFFSFLYSFGIIDSLFISKNRKIIILCIFLLSAFVSPPDPLPQLIIFIFFSFFMEFFIWTGFLVQSIFQIK